MVRDSTNLRNWTGERCSAVIREHYEAAGLVEVYYMIPSSCVRFGILNPFVGMTLGTSTRSQYPDTFAQKINYWVGDDSS